MSASLKIAVLEDNNDLRGLLVSLMERHGHQAFGLYDAEVLDDALVSREIDLLLLDLNLPGEDGLSVARRLKAVMPKLFIIMTTGRGGVEDRAAGYESGGDIYLPKPVSERELMAAVSTVARRICQDREAACGLRLQYADLQLIGSGAVRLSPSEAIILKCLIQSPDRRVETWQLLEATGRDVTERSKASLEVQMTGLRKKIAGAGYYPPAIRVRRKEGYQLLCPIVIF